MADKKHIPAALRKRKKNQSWLGTDLEDSGRGRKQRIDEWNRTLEDIEERIKRLRKDYDRYFMKIEKREPIMDRALVERMLRHFDIPRGTPAHIKFRYQNLMQRFAIMKTYWERCLRQMEEGRYHRFKARLNPPAEERPPKAEPAKKVKSTKDGDVFKSLYKDYVLAQKEHGGPIPSYAVFAGSLKKKAVQHQQKNQNETLRFKVVSENGSVRVDSTPE